MKFLISLVLTTCFFTLPLFSNETVFNLDEIIGKNSSKENSSNGTSQKQRSPKNSRGNFFVDASFLYWQARLDQLEYAFLLTEDITQMQSGSPFTTDIDVTTASSKVVDFSWRPGVQATLGYGFCNSNWLMTLTGTYFHSGSKGNTFYPPVFTPDGSHIEFLSPLWSPGIIGRVVSSANAEWTFTYGVLDLLFVADFSNRRSCVEFLPYFGIRAAQLKQSYDITYKGAFFEVPGGDVLTNPNPTTVQDSSRYNGIGLKVGNKLNIPLFYSFSLFGEASGSLLYGKNKISEVINGAFPVNLGSSFGLFALNFPMDSGLNCLFANLEVEAGVSYGLPLQWCGRCWNFFLSASYHFSIWFDQNNFHDIFFTEPPLAMSVQNNLFNIQEKYGNLQIQGLMVTLGLEF